MKYALYQSGGASVILPGRTLIEAVESNIRTLIHAANVGSAAGTQLVEVTTTYNPNILGRKGGAVVSITGRGLPLAHRPGEYGPVHTGEVWIEGVDADELPAPYTHELKGVA